MNAAAHGRPCRAGLIAVLAAMLLVAFAGLALAQGTPFGVPRPPAGAPPPGADGLVGWLLAKQAEFYRQFAGLVRSAKADGSAVWTLLGVAFLYGVFHAAGPGHGKAVISSYVIANNETWRRGVVLAFASSLVQALAAVLLVGIAAALIGATRSTMDSAVRWIEVISYGLIALIGARLMLIKGRALIRAWRRTGRRAAPVGAAVTAPDHHHDHGHAVHGHGSDRGPPRPGHDHHDAHDHHAAHAVHAHHHAAGEACDEHCGHAHAPPPQLLAGRGGWQRGLAAIFAVGLRPCSGAILVLVFALAQGLFWAGVGATLAMGLGTAVTVAAIATLAVVARGMAARLASASDGYGAMALRAVEFAAAGVVLAFGLLLLVGYIASERMFA